MHRVIRFLFASIALFLVVSSFRGGGVIAAQEFSLNREKIRPVPIQSGVVNLSPENTSIEFIGTHVGAETKPRLGGFEKFQGEISVDGSSIQSLNVEIDIGSVWTEFSNLTRHLQQPDFLDAGAFGSAKFESTSIVPGKTDGEVSIDGNLTLHGETEKISIPGKLDVGENGLTLISLFKIDRTAFGMNQNLEGVDPTVSIGVVVGQPTAAKKEQANAGGGRRRRGGGGGGGQAQSEPPPAAPASGLRVGDVVESWHPIHVAGPDKGTRACPICNYPEYPAVIIFANDGENTAALLSEMEQLLADPNHDDLKIFFVVMDTPRSKLEQLATDLTVSRVAVCEIDPESKEKVFADYQIDASKGNTVMVYQNFKVHANFVDLSAADLADFKQAVATMME